LESKIKRFKKGAYTDFNTQSPKILVDAALNGDFEKALAAMKSDPLLPSPEIARPLLEELIAAIKGWLPQF
jgi:6-phospho-beta-glucosidase